MKEMIYTARLKERVVLKIGKYKGYNYWITSLGSHPCAYVELPKTHPYYGKCDCEAYDLPIDVHGGITYGEFGLGGTIDNEKFLLGWDYAHYNDYMECSIPLDYMDYAKKWTVEEIFKDVKDVINQLIAVENKEKRRKNDK